VSTPPSERSLVLVKPDAVRRGLVGEIVGRFERKGLVIEAIQLRTMDAELADQHYADHVEKAFYPPLKDFMTSGPLVAMVPSTAAMSLRAGAMGRPVWFANVDPSQLSSQAMGRRALRESAVTGGCGTRRWRYR